MVWMHREKGEDLSSDYILTGTRHFIFRQRGCISGPLISPCRVENDDADDFTTQ